MRIRYTSIFVDDQERALRFYTEKLGFDTRSDIPLGEARWLTVVAREDPDGPEIVLEPSSHPAVGPFKTALVEDGIPMNMFTVDDIEAEVARLKGLGVVFTQEPLDVGTVITAVFDDTCGNLLQLAQLK